MDQVTAWIAARPLWFCYLLFGVLALLLARKSQVDAWVEAHPRIGGIMKALRGAGLDPWLIVQGICLIVLGRLPKKPVIDTKPKPPSALALLLLSLGLALSVATLQPACSSLPPPPSKAQVIEASKALAFNEAAVALALLDEAETKRQDAIAQPTDAQVVQASARVALLRTARNDLELVRDWIEGTSDADGPRLIHEAIENLQRVVDSVKAEGGTVPPEVEKAIDLGGKYL
jgi:hypothetical protein